MGFAALEGIEEVEAPAAPEGSRDASDAAGGAYSGDFPARPPAASAPATSLEERVVGLRTIVKQVAACTGCRLCHGRTNTVPGEGNPDARLMFIGEGPGHNEDLQGRPFVGAAGDLLTKIIGAMGLAREEVFIANVVKCRPPGNRKPELDEMEACLPYLQRQVDLIAPDAIVALGKTALEGLMPDKRRTPMSAIRGTWLEYRGVPVMPTFHPAYLLRNPAGKRPVWEDMQQVMDALGLKRGT